MKAIIISILAILLINPFVNACGGGAVVYHAKFHMEDGTCHTGFFEVMGYESYSYLGEDNANEFCTNEGILQIVEDQVNQRADWVSNLDAPGTFTLFRKIYYKTVQSEAFPVDGMTLAIVTPDDKVSIRLEDIAATEFLGAEPSRRDFYTGGFLTGPKELIELLDEFPLVSQLYIDAEETIGVSYLMLNFNDWINQDEMERLKGLKVNKLGFPDLYSDDYIYMDELDTPHYDFDKQKAAYRHYDEQVQDIKNWFYDWNIVLVEVWEGC
ncbi:MAG: hypothetical protein AAF502_10970 [Bacteroidota bacterium]